MMIRQHQREKLRDATRNDFKHQLIRSLRESFPVQRAILPPEAFAFIAEDGISRAHGYGFTTSTNIAQYAHMMLAFGHMFDRDPMFLWASEILNSEHIFDEQLKGDILRMRAREYVAKVFGHKNHCLCEAIGEITRITYEMIPAGADYPPTADVERFLNKIHPSKLGAMRDGALHDAVRIAKNKVDYYCRTGPDKMVPLYLTLMLLMGADFDNDPAFPWAKSALALGDARHLLSVVHEQARVMLALLSKME